MSEISVDLDWLAANVTQRVIYRATTIDSYIASALVHRDKIRSFDDIDFNRTVLSHHPLVEHITDLMREAKEDKCA